MIQNINLQLMLSRTMINTGSHVDFCVTSPSECDVTVTPQDV